MDMSFQPAHNFIHGLYQTEEGHGQAVAFSPALPGTMFACAVGSNYGLEGDGHLLILDHNETGIQEILKIDYRDNIYDVCWSESEPNILATASGDGLINIWNIGNKFPKIPVQEFKGHGKKEMSSVSWNLPKFSNRILASSWDGTTSVYDLQSPPWPVFKIKTASGFNTKTNQSVWSPHTPQVFLAASSDHRLTLWDVSTSVEAPQVVFQASNCDVLTCDWAKYNDTTIVSGGADSTLYGWDIRNSSSPMFQLHDHGQAVKLVKFSPYHPSVIASASYDMTVRIHDFHVSDTSLAILDYHSEFVYGLDWNLHVKGEIVSCAWDKTIKISRLPFLL